MSDEIKKIRSFHDLEVWRKSHQLAQEIFRLSDTFPRKYAFDITAQLRRAALSVPTNIAEGCAASSSKELVQFLSISKRSVSEVQYLLLFAAEQGLLGEDRYRELDARYEEIHRMLGGLRRSLREAQLVYSVSRHSSLVTRH